MAVPTVSVVIPVFNAEKTIVRALDSVMGQTFTDFEIIVVNDGSKDGSAELVRQYKHQVKLIEQKNAGAAAARNTAVKQASGKYIAFLDADDVWLPVKLEEQVRVMEANPSCVISHTDVLSFEEREWHENEVAFDINVHLGLKYLWRTFEEVFKAPYLATPTVMMKRIVFNEIGGFNQNYKVAEDVDLWIRASFNSGAIKLDAPLVCVIVQKEGLSNTYGVNGFLSHLKVIDEFASKHTDYCSKHPKLLAASKAMVMEKLGSAYLVDKKNRLAKVTLIESVKLRVTPRSLYLLIKAAFRLA